MPEAGRTQRDRRGSGVVVRFVVEGEGGFTLVDCSVSPGFSWQGFELMQSGSDVARTLREAGGKVA